MDPPGAALLGCVNLTDYGGLDGITAWVVCPSDNTGQGGSNPNRWCRGQDLNFNVYYWAMGAPS